MITQNCRSPKQNESSYKSIIIVSVVSVFQYCYGQQSNKITPEAWIADIDYLQNNVSQTFPDFESILVQKVSRRNNFFKRWVGLQIGNGNLVRYPKALGVLGDDGCNILPFQEAISTKLLPISMYPFEDGWYICDAKTNL